MIRWLIENVGLMLLAFVIAMVVWVAAEWDKDKIIEGEFEQPVPIEVENQPPDTYLVDGWQQEVRVRLRAPESVWDQLRSGDLRAVANLASLDEGLLAPGRHLVSLQIVIKDIEQIRVLRVEPRDIEIELEAIRTRAVPVDVQVRGEPDLGYTVSGQVVVSDTIKAIVSDTVEVRGPASQADQVSQAVGSVSLRGRRETLDEEVALTPVDAEGKLVEGVTLEPKRVRVRVPVEPVPNVKELSVTIDRQGRPAEGYRVTNVHIVPPVVRVLGPVNILNDLPGILSTVPISIQGRTEDVVERLPLELPPGVAVIDPSEPAVQVTIDIEPIPGSVTVTRTVTFQGLQPRLMAVASPQVVEMILSGPLPRLSALLPEDVRVILDLSDLRLGDEAQLEPVVVLPTGITKESMIPAVIQVRISLEPTPTPEPQN
jgi:YbbR domain-containing protein